MSVDIESEAVIQLILQFLKEQGLSDSVATLQEETNVSLTALDNRDQFIQEIENGQWEIVLDRAMRLKIAHRHLIDLYEQVVLELIEVEELGAARMLFQQTEAMHILKQQDQDRYIRLEHIMSRSVFDPKDIYPSGVTKEKRRHVIAHALAKQIDVIAPERLRTLLEESAQWQIEQGLLQPDDAFDVFRDAKFVQKTETDAFANNRYSTIKFPSKDTYAESLAFSPNGQYLASGSVDGFIEIWNHLNGKLRKDISYQAENNLMAMDNSVISMNFSTDSELLATGSTDGKIVIWKVQLGFRQRQISPAHSQGVTSVCFSNDKKHILSGSYDHLAKIHSVSTGKLTLTLEGHTSFINTVMYSSDESQIWTASTDGTVKIWNAASAACLHTIQPASDLLPIHSIIRIPNQAATLCCNKSGTLSVLSGEGKVIQKLHHPSASGRYFIAAAVSPQGKLVYALTDDAVLYCFRLSTGAVEGTVQPSERELIGLVAHPLSNVVACNDDQGRVYLLDVKK